MKHNTIIIILVGLLVLVLLGGAFTFFGTDMPRDFFGEKTKIAPIIHKDSVSQGFVEVPLTSDNEKRDSNPNEHYTYSVHYPSIALVGHPDLAKDANAVIATYANDKIEAFVRNVRENASPEIPTEFTSDLTVRWGATLLSPTILSFRFDEAEYYAGAAHPNSQISILNYDLEHKAIISTKELFASSSTALLFLSEYARNEEKINLVGSAEMTEYQDMYVPGTEPIEDNFKNVSLSKEGLTIQFNPYQVAPYARGGQEVHIPLEILKNKLTKRVIEAITLASTNMVEATPIMNDQ